MAWWPWRERWTRRPTTATAVDRDRTELTASALTVSAASTVTGARRNLITPYESWQRELWDNYDTMGEFGYAVTWRANMISRIRLRAGRLQVGQDEPTIVDDGRAAELVADLFATAANQSDTLAALSTFLDIPGEGWAIGERRDGRNYWQVRSSDEVRQRGTEFEVIDETSHAGYVVWRDLNTDSLVVRIWRPHRRLRHLAYSPAKSARSAMRELELANRHIQAQYLSRLASAGIVLLPDEITFPVRPEFADAPDPFVREWVETAAEAIKTPGTAAAVVPIPVRVPGEYIDKIKHVDFTLRIDERIIEKRDSARRQLATMLNVPTELLFDSANLNHWGLWQMEESAIKIFITPDVEIMTHGLTVGYLWPMLRAEGVDDWRDWVVWYDASEITTRPDKSNNAVKLYDRFELSGQALRRETGFDEDDAPTDDELETMVLKRLAANPTIGFLALHELTGIEVTGVPFDVPAEADEHVANDRVGDDEEDRSLPERGTEPVEPDADLATRLRRRDAFTVLQATSQHVMEFTVAGWRLKHPLLCQPKLFSCPFTYATRDGVAIYPGTYGDYECTLGSTGNIQLGRRVYPSGDELLTTDPGTTNGYRR